MLAATLSAHFDDNILLETVAYLVPLSIVGYDRGPGTNTGHQT